MTLAASVLGLALLGSLGLATAAPQASAGDVALDKRDSGFGIGQPIDSTGKGGPILGKNFHPGLDSWFAVQSEKEFTYLSLTQSRLGRGNQQGA